jgi:peptidoglycan/LPS O-acetylase OafA/YrhL
MLTISPRTEPRETGVRQRHLPVLDGLRGVAVLGVLVGHFYQKPIFSGEPLASMILSRLAGAGGYGVQLFFVLSGFLITGILIDNKDSPGSLFKFYVRRCLRIFPLYYLALTIIFLILPHFVEFDAGARTIADKQLWLWTYMANWPSLGWIWDDSNLFLIGHFWTLCVEEHFYAFWPALVYLLPRRSLAPACVFLLFVGLVSRFTFAVMGADCPTLLQWPTLTRIDGLAVGALLAIAFRDSSLQATLPDGRYFRRGVMVLGFLFICVIGMPRWMRTEFVVVFSESIVAVLAGLAVLGALRAKRGDVVSGFLNSRFLIIFGKYSYGLYVIHGILRPQFARLLELDVPAPTSTAAAVLYQTLYYIVAIGGTFLLAYASYHLFEKHFLAMKRFVSYKGERI